MTNLHPEFESQRPFMTFMHKMIGYCVKFLAILMIILIFFSLIDVAYVFYEKIIHATPMGLLGIDSILSILGSIMIVLICIEIFNNIVFYFKDDKSHVKLVIATAMIAVSRKIIILDYNATEPASIYATAAAIIATAIAYWLVAYKVPDTPTSPSNRFFP